MGKLKKKPDATKDDGQKKISSFFQKPSSANLFTHVGDNSKLTNQRTVLAQTTKQSKLSNLKTPAASSEVVVVSDSEDFEETSSLKQKTAVSIKQSKGGVSESSKYLKKHASRFPATSSTCCKTVEPAVIPETQVAFTPDTKLSYASVQNAREKENTFVSPVSKVCIDDGIIPDTPENVSGQNKHKQPFSRSFLLSSSQFASNPIQKAKENREAKLAMKKKMAALARNRGVTVSVNFKTDSKVDDFNTKNPFKCMKSTDSTKAAEKSKMKCTNENGQVVNGVLEENTGTVVELEECTPTKVYSDGLSIKRMSKSGISPENKRLVKSDVDVQQESAVDVSDKVRKETEVNGEPVVKQLDFDMKEFRAVDGDLTRSYAESEIAAKPEESDDIEKINERFAAALEQQERAKKAQRAEREKARQQRMAERKKKQAEERSKNCETLMKYQLGNTVKEPLSELKDKSVVNDDALEDILIELYSPGTVKKVGNGTNQKLNEGSRKVAEQYKNQSAKQEGKGVGQQDRKQAGHRNSASGLNGITKIKKYSLYKVLTVGKCVSCDQRNGDSSCCKRINSTYININVDELDHPPKRHYLTNKEMEQLSHSWTEEDESYFADLGVKTTAEIGDESEKSNEAEDKSSKFSDNNMVTNLSCSWIKLKNTDNGITCMKNKVGSFDNDGDQVMSNKVSSDTDCDAVQGITTYATQTCPEIITVYPTQGCQAIVRSRSPSDEMEIDEYNTQVESQGICQGMASLSPFKQQREQQESATGSQSQGTAPCVEYGRHIVTGIQHDSCKQQTVLQITSQPGEVNRTCILHGFWLETHIQQGDIVNVLAKFEDDVCHITDTQGLLVVNPDLLLSGTTIVSSVFCMRRSILKEKFKGCDSRNIQMSYGSIIHSVFQQVLRKKLVTEEEILQEASSIVKQTGYLLEMYANKVNADRVMEEIQSYLPQIMEWTRQYTNIGQNILGNQRSTNPDVLVTKISDIEENIWSPRLGVKGKIDLTVQTKLKENGGRCVELPLELKTGRPSYSVEHKGQVTLYSMMSADRRPAPGKGLLLYLKDTSMKVIPADHINQKGLIQLRNEMAYYISRQVVKSTDDGGKTFTLGRLPEPIRNLRACQKCPQLLNCSIYQRMVEERSHDHNGMSGLVSEALEHLSVDHMTYFSQWCLMLDLETQTDQSKHTMADIWLKSSSEREKLGQCVGEMVLQTDCLPVSSGSQQNDSDTVILTFTRQEQRPHIPSLISCGLATQDSVVISSEDPSWIAVCTGFVQHVSERQVAVLTDSDACDRLRSLKDRVFRIDKCDNFSTAGIFYTNVSRLMLNEAHSQHLRHLVIDRVKPAFQNTLSKNNIEKVKPIFKTLNKPQKTAILKVLMSKDYVLIKGYPGTGKTSTIVALVKVLYALGQSVLLTSYTHSAVDNILLKLKKDNVKFLRLGRISKIHKDIQEFSADRLMQDFTTTEEMDTFFNNQNIVATSCLGTNHPLFSQRRFDVCIVDEASQVLQPACLGPLFCCGKFVLVGDPQQLPPVVQSKEARSLGMSDSLFTCLDGLGATFDLSLQYRMNSEIMYLSNKLIYGDCLKCGSDNVANRTVGLPQVQDVSQVLELSPWMKKVVSDSLRDSVVFLDTQKISAPETKDSGMGIRNEREADLVLQMVTTLIKAGLDPGEIGIIAPYRSQVTFIRKCLQGKGQPIFSNVEVNTVDQYQGRDKSLIIISFVRSLQDSDTKTGELLKDVRRLNVAITRAKMKLILLGHRPSLQQYEPLQQLLSLLQAKQQITCIS